MGIMSLVVTTAAMLLRTDWGDEGLVTLVMVKTMGLPALNVPAVNDTISTTCDDMLTVPAASNGSDDMLKVPAASLGEENASEDVSESVIPAPARKTMILPFKGTIMDSGVITTVIVTLVSPMLVLLRVMLGRLAPK